MNHKDLRRELTFREEEIRVLPTEVGRMVTVTLEQVPDLKMVTLILLIPTSTRKGR